VDKATLVRSDLEIEGRVLAALSLARIPVTLCDLNYVPQLDEWQVVIATPWHDTKGPRETYARVIKALQEAAIYDQVPIRRIFLKSPDDPLVKSLEREIMAKSEGAVHILAENRNANTERRYSVIFAPFAGPGGAVPSRRFVGEDSLRGFLENDLYISRSSIDEAISELHRKGSTSLFNVQLTRKELRKLRLG
jgi:hypothetical protein